MKTTPPSLPFAQDQYDKSYHDRLNRILTLFFNELLAVGPFEATTLKLVGLPAVGTLHHPVTATDTVITLHDASLFPIEGFGTIESEVISWTGKTGNDLTGVMRGQLGTTATSHAGNTLLVAAVGAGTVYAGIDKILRVL